LGDSNIQVGKNFDAIGHIIRLKVGNGLLNVKEGIKPTDPEIRKTGGLVFCITPIEKWIISVYSVGINTNKSLVSVVIT